MDRTILVVTTSTKWHSGQALRCAPARCQHNSYFVPFQGEMARRQIRQLPSLTPITWGFKNRQGLPDGAPSPKGLVAACRTSAGSVSPNSMSQFFCRAQMAWSSGGARTLKLPVRPECMCTCMVGYRQSPPCISLVRMHRPFHTAFPLMSANSIHGYQLHCVSRRSKTWLLSPLFTR